MKRIMSRSFIVFIVAFAFFVGAGFFVFRLSTLNKVWIEQPYNGHIYSNNGFAKAGEITDRDGKVLAYTNEDGDRVYHDDEGIRRAMLHVVGDDSHNISTALQSMFMGNLSGYSMATGLGLPESMTGSSDVKLCIDAEASKAVYEAFSGQKGACVVYNYKTGEVLIDVSMPTYDPENPPVITEENESEYNGVYLDNVVSSTYTPGSIFKIVTAVAGIEHIPDINERTFYCEGAYDIDGLKITCESAHGSTSFNDAFKHSCNIVFAQIAVEVGADKMNAVAEQLGFNKSFYVNGIELKQSKYSLENAYGDNQLGWSGIGQFEDLANPMHMAIMCGAIANGGTPQVPYLFKDNSFLNKLGLQGSQKIDAMLSGSTAKKLFDMMISTGEYYNAVRGVSMGGLQFGAKTGTAEIGEGKQPHGWIVGFTNDSEHPYAFAVVVEEGGYGISSAAPIAQAAINALVK